MSNAEFYTRNSALEEDASKENDTPNTISEFLDAKYHRKFECAMSNNENWLKTTDRLPRNCTKTELVEVMRCVLQALSNNDLNFGLRMMKSILSNDEGMRPLIESKDSTANKIITLIQEWTSEKLGNTRKKEENDALCALIQACTYSNDSDNAETCKLLSLTNSAFYNDLNVVQNDSILHTVITHDKSEGTKLKEQCMLAFCHADELSTIYSNSRRIVDVIVNRENEKHSGRVWNAFVVT